MTLNERLFVANLLDEFGRAAKVRSREAMIDLLERVGTTRQGAESSVDDILASPAKYGF